MTPVFTVISAACWLIVRKPSSVVRQYRTGRPASRESRMAIGSVLQLFLAPKPPPTNGTFTRIRDSGMPRTRASSLRSGNGFWVEVQISVCSPRTSATVTNGSRWKWFIRENVNVSVNTWSHDAQTASPPQDPPGPVSYRNS